MSFKWMPIPIHVAKVERLKAEGCSKIYEDHINNGQTRTALATLIAECAPGDVLVVERLSDAARSMFEVKWLFETLNRKSVDLRIMYFFGENPLDTRDASGSQLADYVRQFSDVVENGIIERRLGGIAAAKIGGAYRGRKPLPQEKIDRIIEQFEAGTLPRNIGKAEGVSRASVYRVLKHHRAAKETTKQLSE